MTELSRRSFMLALGALPLASRAAGSARWNDSCDIAIAGGGAAGLAAAVSAAKAGARVMLFEKARALGGNTRIASGYVTGPWKKRQQPQGIEDSPKKFASDMARNAGPTGDRERIEVLAREAVPTLEWLESLGLRFQPGVFVVSGEHFPRAYKPVAPNGEGYVTVLGRAARAAGVRIFLGSEVSELVTDRSGRVTGVTVRDTCGEVRRVGARKGVLIASGGFAGNDSMIRRYAPRYAGLTHDNAPGITGKLIEAAAAAGAQLLDMDKVQCQPGCPAGRTHRVRLHNEPNRFILIDRAGRRFIREDARRDVLRDAVQALPERMAFALVDAEGFRQYNRMIQRETVWGVETGDAFNSYSLEGLARKIGVPPKALAETVSRYNDAVAIQYDRLGKDMTFCHTIEKPPFWACFAAMTRHATEGGIRVDTQGRALRADGSRVEGLWAAGEATGGLHGRNQMGGNGLTEALAFGRIAGEAMAGKATPFL